MYSDPLKAKSLYYLVGYADGLYYYYTLNSNPETTLSLDGEAPNAYMQADSYRGADLPWFQVVKNNKQVILKCDKSTYQTNLGLILSTTGDYLDLIPTSIDTSYYLTAPEDDDSNIYGTSCVYPGLWYQVSNESGGGSLKWATAQCYNGSQSSFCKEGLKTELDKNRMVIMLVPLNDSDAGYDYTVSQAYVEEACGYSVETDVGLHYFELWARGETKCKRSEDGAPTAESDGCYYDSITTCQKMYLGELCDSNYCGDCMGLISEDNTTDCCVYRKGTPPLKNGGTSDNDDDNDDNDTTSLWLLLLLLVFIIIGVVIMCACGCGCKKGDHYNDTVPVVTGSDAGISS